MRYLVQGEKVDSEGSVRGGDGAWFDAVSREDAEAQFLASHVDPVPGVWVWRVTVSDG